MPAPINNLLSSIVKKINEYGRGKRCTNDVGTNLKIFVCSPL